jgi:hypothetical protein
MQRCEENELLSQIRADAERIAAAFGLRYRAIVAEHPRVKSRYGACYSDGLISIRLKHATTGQPLKYSSLMDTLCHELAHLRHFNHGPQFKVFFLKLLGWARQQGIYRPGPQGGAAEVGLFMPSQEALAIALRPPSRNGVPVFPEPPRAVEQGTSELLPWERRARGLPIPMPARRPAPAAPSAAKPAAPRPARARPTAPRAQQLSLF